jgi:hypothetical protein
MTLDISDLISAATRREHALRNGTNHGAWNTGGQWRGPREDATPSRDRPTLLWPDERHLIPRHCWHCGASRLNFDADEPYGAVRHGEITCRLCSRVQVHLKDAGTQSSGDRSVPVVVDPPPRQRRSSVPCTDAECVRPGPAGGPCSTCRTRRVRHQAGGAP